MIHSGGSETAESIRRFTVCCIEGGMSIWVHCSSSTSLADLVKRLAW